MTQTQKHTPGPWHVAARNGDITKVLSYPGFLVAEVRGATGPKAEMRANARLIAAAPELLAALKALFACFNDAGELAEQAQDQLSVAFEKSEAAIAKAERSKP